MNYSIERVCWSKETFNGYEDNPYWKIYINGVYFGLTDDGNLWPFCQDIKVSDYYLSYVSKIVDECKLKIVLKLKD